MTGARGWPYSDPVARQSGRGKRPETKLALAERMRVLDQAPLFSGLARKHLKSIARDTSVRTFYDGATIVREGQKAANCFVIVEGAATVTKQGRQIAVLGRGDVIGELAILDNVPRTATVVATGGEVVAVHISRPRLLEYLEANPKVSLRLLGILARRLRETTESALSAET